MGDNKDYAPMSSIMLFYRFRSRLDTLSSLAKGDNRDYAPMSPI